MAGERNNFSNINIESQNGLPVVSFGTKKTTDSKLSKQRVDLSPENFQISGNVFDAFYDQDHRLIFVLDKTRDKRQPNVLLVINQIQSRKWDDILSNDYNVDLEEIRPKYNNKYQKLDIEYSGLDIYNRLINDHLAGADISTALNNLNKFRNSVAMKFATVRLNAANAEFTVAQDTAQSAQKTINTLVEQKKKLREKLQHQKKMVGKEPTKQSAAKILKIESQIEALNEKSKRATRRFKHAIKRMERAKENSETAKNILAGYQSEMKEGIPMAEDIKPLFNKDPEIIDNNIAFKPIEFTNARPPVETPNTSAQNQAKPMFEPIQISAPQNTYQSQPQVAMPQPVVSSATVPQVMQPNEVLPPAPDLANTPISRPTPIMSGNNNSGGGIEIPIIPKDDTNSHKPSVVYYFMLVVLIVLSIFTLWIYQKNTNNSVRPNLAAQNAEQTSQTSENNNLQDEPINDNPSNGVPDSVFLSDSNNEPAPVTNNVQPEPKPEYDVSGPTAAVDNAEQPVAATQETDQGQQNYAPATTDDESAKVQETPSVPAELPLPMDVNPEYADTQQPVAATEPQYENESVSLPIANETPVAAPEPAAATCTDGTAPDTNGCCTGETLKDIGNGGGFACCPDDGGECFAPIK